MNHERIVAIIADIEKYLQDFDEIKIPITASGGVFHVIITRMGFLMLENPPDKNIESFTQSSQAMGYPPTNEDKITKRFADKRKFLCSFNAIILNC